MEKAGWKRVLSLQLFGEDGRSQESGIVLTTEASAITPVQNLVPGFVCGTLSRAPSVHRLVLRLLVLIRHHNPSQDDQRREIRHCQDLDRGD